MSSMSIDDPQVKWSKHTKTVAAISALCILLLSVVPILQAGDSLLDFWKIFLPLIMAGFTFGMVGLILNHKSQIDFLKTLAGIDYTFGEANVLFVLYIFITVVILLSYLLSIFNIGRPILDLIGSVPGVILLIIALFVVAGAGGQLIPMSRDGKMLYRDSVSASRLSRQDIFFSLCGTWDDGIIVGWRRFTFAGMQQIEEDDKTLLVRGKEGDEAYVLVLYTPRIQERLSELLHQKIKTNI